MRSSHDITLKLRHYSNSPEDCLPVRKGDGYDPAAARFVCRVISLWKSKPSGDDCKDKQETRLQTSKHCFICQWTINKASDIIKSLHNRQLRFSLLTRWEFPLWRKTSKKNCEIAADIESHIFVFYRTSTAQTICAAYRDEMNGFAAAEVAIAEWQLKIFHLRDW